MRGRFARRAALAGGAAALLAAAAPEPQLRLELDPAMLSDEGCLAPVYEGCRREAADEGAERRPSASAALLAPDLPERSHSLSLDVNALRAGDEVSWSCPPSECRSRRRIFAAAPLIS